MHVTSQVLKTFDPLPVWQTNPPELVVDVCLYLIQGLL